MRDILPSIRARPSVSRLILVLAVLCTATAAWLSQGTIGFTGAEGTLTPSGDALPLDVFVVASQDPAVVVGEYARITGYAELPPLWAFTRIEWQPRALAHSTHR